MGVKFLATVAELPQSGIEAITRPDWIGLPGPTTTRVFALITQVQLA